MTLALGGDLADIVVSLQSRVATLEQRLTSPAYAVGSGSSPTFGSVNIGDWPRTAGGTIIPLGMVVSPVTSVVATPNTTLDDVGIDVTWVGPVDNTGQEYLITLTRKNLDGTYSLDGSYRAAGTAAHIGGLVPGVVYGVSVSSINAIGVISYPYPATGYIDVTTAPDATIPAGVTGLTATAGATSVMLDWDENTEPDVVNGNGFYEVEWSTYATFAGATRSRTAATIASFVGLVPGTLYYFHVRAYDASANPGPWSPTVSIQPGDAGSVASTSDGAAPTSSPTPTVVGSVGPVLLVKFPLIVNTDPVTYEVHLSTTSGFTPTSATMAAESKSSNIVLFKDASGAALVYGTTYYVKIIAKDADGAAPASAQASAAPAQAGTSDLAFGSITAASGIIASLDASKISTGTMDASFLTAGTITSDRINATVGLDATLIKFGTMSGDRITAHTLDINSIKTSTLSAVDITLAPTGRIVGGTSPLGASPTGFVISGNSLTFYQSGVARLSLDGLSGNATFAGALSGASGTFSGTLSAGIVTGSTINGGTINGADIYGGYISTSASGTGSRVELNSTNSFGGGSSIVFFSGLAGENAPAYVRSFQTGSTAELQIGGPDFGGSNGSMSFSPNVIELAAGGHYMDIDSTGFTFSGSINMVTGYGITSWGLTTTNGLSVSGGSVFLNGHTLDMGGGSIAGSPNISSPTLSGGTTVTGAGIGMSGLSISSLGGIVFSPIPGGGAGTAANVGTGGTFHVGTSSRRFKQDIATADYVPDDLMGLKPVTFRYINDVEEHGEAAQHVLGLIAEDVALSPDLEPILFRDEQGAPFSVMYDGLTVAVLSAMQHIHPKVQDLLVRQTQTEDRLTALEDTVATLVAHP